MLKLGMQNISALYVGGAKIKRALVGTEVVYEAVRPPAGFSISASVTPASGGSVTGAGQYLKEQNPAVKIVAVEPKDSPILTEGRAGAHGIQGIGAGFVPQVLDTSVYDRVIPVSTEDAYRAARLLGRREGILAGISSGAALHAAIELAREPENRGKTIVTLLPDTGDRYLSTPLFQA